MNSNKVRVCVVGLGYIGLPTASLLATKGFPVVGVDINPDIVKTINRGEIHIYEPELDTLVQAAVQSGNLKASTQPAEADVHIIAVPTPFREGFKPDISYVEAATRAVAPVLKPGNLLVLESTSPVGTTELMEKWILETRPELKENNRIYFAHCPERVLPGNILKELVDNDRIIGGVDTASAKLAEKFYSHFVKGNIILTDAKTAEMCKLTENSFRDVNIAFANELSVICDKLQINVWELIGLANRHPRVNILQPGPGVGGHCIAVDPWFIVDAAPDQAKLIRAARQVNSEKPHFICSKVRERATHFRAPKIACLGLSYKPDIDDLRESPAIEIVEELAKNPDYTIYAVEPHITALPASFNGKKNVRFATTETALKEADVIVRLVNHKSFGEITPQQLKGKLTVDAFGSWQ